MWHALGQQEPVRPPAALLETAEDRIEVLGLHALHEVLDGLAPRCRHARHVVGDIYCLLPPAPGEGLEGARYRVKLRASRLGKRLGLGLGLGLGLWAVKAWKGHDRDSSLMVERSRHIAHAHVKVFVQRRLGWLASMPAYSYVELLAAMVSASKFWTKSKTA